MNIVWFRRNLRLEDNLPLNEAIKENRQILPIFIFDTNILSRFTNPYDRRVNFIAQALFAMNLKLQRFGGKITILYGDPTIVLPKLVAELKVQGNNIENVYADQDFEPVNIQRDSKVAENLGCKLNLICDHLLLKPGTILTGQKTPFKVFTPFSKAFKNKLVDDKVKQANYELDQVKFYQLDAGLVPGIALQNASSAENILEGIGYKYREDDIWKVQEANSILNSFIKNKLATYETDRNFMPESGTSGLSPFVRFGLISIRECFINTYDKANSQMWINELLWREFYANILFHFPHTVNTEFISHYVNKIPWRQDPWMLEALENSATGFPIIDSAMRQLTQDGWMHNRSRMIVASFVTKNLLLDWRLGEELFAKYLMDYDLASNVGGWQWSSSCGTDAQPYFRIFNPIMQSQKFDAEGKYIKKYLPALAKVDKKHIHEGEQIRKFYPEINYPRPIIDYHSSRILALKTFDPKTF
jgi:deoxyribodipyrimidine photo-lyase